MCAARWLLPNIVDHDHTDSMCAAPWLLPHILDHDRTVSMCAARWLLLHMTTQSPCVLHGSCYLKGRGSMSLLYTSLRTRVPVSNRVCGGQGVAVRCGAKQGTVPVGVEWRLRGRRAEINARHLLERVRRVQPVIGS